MMRTEKKRTIQYAGILALLSLLLTTILSACSSDPDEGFEHQYEILGELFGELPQATKIIEFGNVPEHAHHLLRSWSGTEEELRWTNAETAEISFFHTGVKSDLELKIEWASMASTEKKKQETTILLNGKKVKTVSVGTSFTSQDVSLPASKLLPGLNILRFQFSYTESPAALDPTSQDERELAVAFKSIRFSSEAPQKLVFQTINPQEFLQKPNLALGSFYEFPANFALDVEYQSVKGAKASLEIVNEKGKRWKIALPSGKTTMTKVFSLPQEGLYRVHAICRGTEDGGMVWKNVRLRTKTEQKALEAPEQGFVKASESNAGMPDILLYVIDTLRADHISSYGYERETSPAIDAFADANARYKNAYATSSWTKPSGASILSGLLPRNHQAVSRTAKLPEDVVTLGEILRKQGYYTAAFMTNGSLADYFGFDRGFDDFIFFPEDFNSKEIHARAATVNEKVFTFLDEYTKTPERKPLFLLFWSTEPHDPYTPPEEFQKLFDIGRFTPIDTPLKLLSNIRHEGLEPTASQIEYIKARYDQEIFSNDRAFGDLVTRLKALGIYEDMTLILTADHGEEFFEHGSVGHGLTLYNEQIRIPLIVKSSHIAPGVYDEPVQLIDIYPTILDALGIEPPYTLDGISLIHFGQGHAALYAEQELAGNDLAMRLDTDKKIILNKQYFRPPLNPVMPVFEVYAADDLDERERSELKGFDDYSRLQELTSYVTTRGGLGFQQSDTELSPELDRKLRDLGYVK